MRLTMDLGPNSLHVFLWTLSHCARLAKLLFRSPYAFAHAVLCLCLSVCAKKFSSKMHGNEAFLPPTPEDREKCETRTGKWGNVSEFPKRVALVVFLSAVAKTLSSRKELVGRRISGNFRKTVWIISSQRIYVSCHVPENISTSS